LCVQDEVSGTIPFTSSFFYIQIILGGTAMKLTVGKRYNVLISNVVRNTQITNAEYIGLFPDYSPDSDGELCHFFDDDSYPGRIHVEENDIIKIEEAD